MLKARLSFFNPDGGRALSRFPGGDVSQGLPGHVFPERPGRPAEAGIRLVSAAPVRRTSWPFWPSASPSRRTYSYDTSSQLGTGSLLSFQLAEEAKKRAERLFSLDRFRIDPFVLGASTEMTARLTVGKKISRNIMSSVFDQPDEPARGDRSGWNGNSARVFRSSACATNGGGSASMRKSGKDFKAVLLGPAVLRPFRVAFLAGGRHRAPVAASSPGISVKVDDGPAGPGHRKPRHDRGRENPIL